MIGSKLNSAMERVFRWWVRRQAERKADEEAALAVMRSAGIPGGYRPRNLFEAMETIEKLSAAEAVAEREKLRRIRLEAYNREIDRIIKSLLLLKK